MIFKKNLFLIIIFFLFGSTNLWSSEKIAFLDVEFIINKSEPALLIIKKIEKIRDQETKKLNQIENNLKKKNEDLIKTKNLISDEELKKKISSLRDEAKSFDELRKMTLENLKESISLIELFTDNNFETNKIIRGNSLYDFYNLFHGPISDSLYLIGQLVAFRRASGNPIPKGVNHFLGKKMN